MKRNYIVLLKKDKDVKETYLPTVTSKNIPAARAATGKIKTHKQATLPIRVELMEPKKAAVMAARPDVLSVVPPMPMKLISPKARTKPFKSNGQTNAWGIEATGANTSPFAGEGITVAVLDTGINKEHSAFKDQGITFNIKNFTGDKEDHDTDGHGTHCAGTIFGRDIDVGKNQDKLRIGVATGVENVLIGKVIGKKGGGSEQIASAINWALENGAHVISMSLGIDFPGYVKQLKQEGVPVDIATSIALEGYRANILLFQTLAEHVNAREHFGQPALLIAAAGNESQRDIHEDYEIAVSPPAVSEGFISVGALGQVKKKWKIADFSNTGPLISGPGVDIISAHYKGGVISMSGTSMATPHVAGIAALWAQKLNAQKSLTAKNLMADLIASGITQHMVKGYNSASIGKGMVQAPQE